MSSADPELKHGENESFARGSTCRDLIYALPAPVRLTTRQTHIGQWRMFLLSEPSKNTVAGFISSQRDQPFTYSAVGATNATPPVGFKLDHNRIRLGNGKETYERAIEALRKWRQFDLGWVSIVPEGVPIEVGSTVAVKARAFGSWSLSATRVVYLIDDDGPVKRFGFAYGTLPDHVECGEERFTVEWHDADDSVWFDILAFSKPRHPLVRLSFPLARMLQKRFAREAMERMRKEVNNNAGT